ncbi:MAG: twitch domain-containing radical SAM protein, partial [Geminicoccaceae bacterium]
MTSKKPTSDNPYFCILAWIHLYVTPSSEVFPCCFGATDQPVGNLLQDDLTGIMNGEGMKALRRRMLSGRKSHHCRRCYKAEALGFRTMRQNSNAKFERHLEQCDLTGEDGHLDDVALRYLDVRFSNICNLKCRFCWHECSSSWYEDYKFLNPGYDKTRIMKAGRSDDHLWGQIVDQLSTVDDIYFAGGEPLLMQEHYRILQHLDGAERYEVELSYTTNLSTLSYKTLDVTDLWRKFRSVAVGVSLDGLGSRGEYIRKGLDWQQFIINLETVRECCPHVDLSANLTINILNIFDLISIYNHLESHDVFQGIRLEINFLDQPEAYSVQVLPRHVKAELSAEFLDYAENA